MNNIIKNKKTHNIKIYILIFVLILVPLILIVNNKKMNKEPDLSEIENSISKKVLIEMVKIEKKNEIFEYSGFLEPREVVNITSQADGKINQILVNQGEKVSKDMILFEIDEHEKKAEFEKAEQALKQKNEELKANQKLFNEKIISKVKLSESETLQKEAVANLERAKKNLEFTKIKAPIDGYIDKINLKIGDYVKSMNREIIAKIFSDEGFLVSIFISQNNIFQIKKNQEANFIIDFNDSKKIIKKGKVNFISNIADQFTRTYYAELLIDKEENNDDLAKAIGSSVNVKIIGEQKSAIQINDSIVFLDENGSLIIKVLDKDNMVKFLTIKAIDNIENDPKNWFLVKDEEIKKLNLLDENGFLRIIIRGGGFFEKDEKIDNFDFT